MSMNFIIIAQRKVRVLATGKVETQVVYPDVWQTPTRVTYEILKSPDPLAAYFDWVLSVSEDEKVPVYADDDIFLEHVPVRFEIDNAGKEHIKELSEEIAALRSEGYEIEYTDI